MTPIIFIHFGEMSTKGCNRSSFVDRLYVNVSSALSCLKVEVKRHYDHLEVYPNKEEENKIIDILSRISGIARITPCIKVDRNIEEIKKAALTLLNQEAGHLFKIKTVRADKTFPISSRDVTIETADYILENTSYKVDLHNYDILLKISIKESGIYLSVKEYPGSGGYPLGMSGKVMLMLSGGIDSPVAAYSLLRRGIAIECIHFASPPYTSEAVIDKLIDILSKLNIYQPRIYLHIVPFTKIQEHISEYVPEPYRITILRRMMMRIATKVAVDKGCLGIATGESIGQVASQTLQSIQVINEVTSYPVLRPLSTVDKMDIVKIAKMIDTYEISIRPYEDCCTIFKPKSPKTKPKLKDCLYYESKWDYLAEIEEAISNIKTLRIKNQTVETR